MFVCDESLTMVCQMYEGWLRETGKLESLGQPMYLPGETIFIAFMGRCMTFTLGSLSLRSVRKVESVQCFVVVFKCFS